VSGSELFSGFAEGEGCQLATLFRRSTLGRGDGGTSRTATAEHGAAGEPQRVLPIAWQGIQGHGSRNVTTLSSDVYLINPEGHTGLAYPDYELCTALVGLGVDVTYLTCREYPLSHLAHAFRVVPFFVGATKCKLLSAARYVWAVVRLSARFWHKAPAILCFEAPRIPLMDLLFFVGARVRGHKLILAIHDVVPLDARLRLVMLPALYHLADKLLVFSQNAREELAERHGIGENKVTLIPQSGFLHLASAGLSKTESRSELRIPFSSKVILSFGVVRRSKGQAVLVLAMPALLEAVPDAFLVIAGRPMRTEGREIKALIEELGIEDHVLLDLRFIPDDAVPSYFSAADVVALPYLRSYHSSVLEVAYSFGKPVVASRVGGLAEAIEEGKTGLLVAPGSAMELAECLISVLGDDDEVLAEMSKAVASIATHRHSWLAAGHYLLGLFRSLGYPG
jgi:D-inositol-3-phosphate glycosyltransferase